MRKIKFFSVLALVLSVFGLNFSSVHANTATEVKTDLGITIKEVDGPLNPVDPWDPQEPDKPGVVDPEEDEGSKPNEGIGNAKLGIWRIPGKMIFEGELDFTKDYSLPMTGTNKQRVVSVADVRGKSDTNWKLSGQLTDLTSASSGVIKNGYSLKIGDIEAKKHKIEGNKIYAKQFEDNANGVITPTNISLNKTAKEIARAENGNGKGCTGILFNDMSLDFDAGVGTAESYTGQIIWTLSDTIN